MTAGHVRPAAPVAVQPRCITRATARATSRDEGTQRRLTLRKVGCPPKESESTYNRSGADKAETRASPCRYGGLINLEQPAASTDRSRAILAVKGHSKPVEPPQAEIVPRHQIAVQSVETCLSVNKAVI
jgi:hypothetical protein